MQSLMLLKNFLTDKDVATIAPSSRFSIKKLCKKIDFNKRNVIVEYGPGNGCISFPILKKMNKDSKLIVVEKNKNLVKYLKKTKDPRFIVEDDIAHNVQQILRKHGEEKADIILSGIPLSFFNKKQKTDLMKKTYESLNPEGKFLVYQFSREAEKYLEKQFDQVNKQFEILNIPPLAIFEAIRK